MVASENIQAGDEITDGYSYQYRDQAYEARQQWLRDHYKFDCECRACHQKWPLYEGCKQAVPRPGKNKKDLENMEEKFWKVNSLAREELRKGNYDR